MVAYDAPPRKQSVLSSQGALTFFLRAELKNANTPRPANIGDIHFIIEIDYSPDFSTTSYYFRELGIIRAVIFKERLPIVRRIS